MHPTGGHGGADFCPFGALRASRRAIAAGDLGKAERWIRLAEAHYRAARLAREEFYRAALAQRRIALKESNGGMSPKI